MKQLKSGGVITNSIMNVKVEFSKGEEVAEYGEYAPSTSSVLVPADSYEQRKDKVLSRMNEYAEKNGFDTIVIQKTIFEEEVFHLVDGGE